MKRNILFIVAMFTIAGHLMAQTDTSGKQFFTLPDSTGRGILDGKLASKQIGSEGGTIVSDDGRVELIFPAGALTANTTISIQPTTNLAPNGVGKSYWFEPSGTQFKKPVQIIFHYTDEEAEICPPDWMSLGIQDHHGKWTFIDYESFDSVSKTLNGFIHHFSGATNINDIMILADKDEILVNNKTYIDMFDIRGYDTSYPGGLRPGLLNQHAVVLWYANGVLHGNSQTGTITQTTAPLGKQKVTVAEYKAPSILPKTNPVKIWAEVYRKTRKGKVLRKRLSTDILVYDMYKISVIHEIKGNEYGIKEFLGGGELIDSGTCIVKVYPDKIKIDSIKNYEPTITKPPGKEHGGTLDLKIFTAGAEGSIHLTDDYYGYRLSGHPPEVFLKFPLRSITGFAVQYVGRQYTGPITTLPYPSIPTEVEFIANGQRQQYNVTIGGIDSHKLIVTPYRKE